MNEKAIGCCPLRHFKAEGVIVYAGVEEEAVGQPSPARLPPAKVVTLAATWRTNAALRNKDAAGRGRGAAVCSGLRSRPCF
ncbi:hypothetical protein [Alloprevotella tannerae]|uniref:hypothetical protein n=1 Tax=Alloprevotella tannerae TaxID=76122 RepID=UPI0028EFA3B3|nr:hypothetical protein [Alloprevotella tannerae]